MSRYEMTSGIDDMVDRQMALLDELRRAERQVAVSHIASMIAHSVGTPLNVIVGRAGLIRRHSNAADSVVSDAKCIEQKVEQLATKLRSIVEILSMPQLTSNGCEVDVILADVVNLYEPIARTRNVTLRLERPRNLIGTVDRNQAFVVLTSLLSLAVHEVESGTTIECTVAWSELTDATQSGQRFISIGLNIPGCSFPDPRALERLETPSDTEPKSVNRMQVLGMCFALLRNVGGRLEVRSVSQGSNITLFWPIDSKWPHGVVD